MSRSAVAAAVQSDRAVEPSPALSGADVARALVAACREFEVDPIRVFDLGLNHTRARALAAIALETRGADRAWVMRVLRFERSGQLTPSRIERMGLGADLVERVAAASRDDAPAWGDAPPEPAEAIELDFTGGAVLPEAVIAELRRVNWQSVSFPQVVRVLSLWNGGVATARIAEDTGLKGKAVGSMLGKLHQLGFWVRKAPGRQPRAVSTGSGGDVPPAEASAARPSSAALHRDDVPAHPGEAGERALPRLDDGPLVDACRAVGGFPRAEKVRGGAVWLNADGGQWVYGRPLSEARA